MNREKIIQRIKFCIIIVIIASAVAFATFTVLKYQVEGEKNMPFNLGKIIVISSACTVNDSNINDNTERTRRKLHME